MKRDMDLVRKLLFVIEDKVGNESEYNITVDGYTMAQVAYHCNLLYDAGMIKDFNASYASNEIYGFCIMGLTWAGHELLDKIREDTIWKKTKDKIKEKALPTTIEVITTVASSIVTTMLNSIKY